MHRLFPFVYLGLSGSLLASQSSLPPASVNDHVYIRHAGKNADAAHWASPSSLGAYRVSGDGYQTPLSPGTSDDQLGLVWKTNKPSSFDNALASLNQTGGTMRVIFVGETAGWLNDFGYTYSGSPTGSGSFTAWKNIQSYGHDRNIAFGDYFDLSMESSELSSLDLWFKANGSWQKSLCDTVYTGGLYTLFDSPGEPSQYLWGDHSLSVNTWIPSISASLLVDTYLISLEDWRIDRGADGDYNDFRFAIQLLGQDGTPLAVIPETVHFALLAGLSLFAVVLKGRFNRPARTTSA